MSTEQMTETTTDQTPETPTETIPEPVETGSVEDYKSSVYDKIIGEEPTDSEEPAKEEPADEEPDEEEPADETEQPAEEKETSEDDPWDEALFRAAQLGMSPKEARQFGTPEVLSLALDKISAAKSGDAETDQPPPTMPQPLADVLKRIEEVKNLPDEEQWDPAYRERDGLYKEAISILITQAANSTQALNDMQQNMFAQQFDVALSSMGESELFGEGPIYAMDGRTKEAINRNKLYGEFSDELDKYRLQGKQPPSFDVLMQRAMRNAFPEHHENKIKNKTKSAVRGHYGMRGGASALPNAKPKGKEYTFDNMEEDPYFSELRERLTGQ